MTDGTRSRPSGWPQDAVPAFRHDPVKSVLPGAGSPAVRWDVEPVVCGYRKLTYDNERLGRTIPVPVSATPAVVTGAGVVAASDDGHVGFFATSLAKVYWQRRLDSSVYASLVVDRSRGRVVVAATSGLVACFDLRGTLAWSTRVADPVYATPTILPSSGVLVVATFNSGCVGLDLAGGEVVFERRLPAPWHAEHGGVAAYRDAYASPVATPDDTALVGCAEHVVCLAADGTELWRHEVGRSVKASPAALHATGEVAVCSVDGRCLFLDAGTGERRGEVLLGSKVTSSPAVSGDVLAVGTQRDTTIGVDVRTREVVWESREGGARGYTSYTVLPDGNFIMTSARGTIVCLRRDDGAFRWETSQVLGLVDHEPAMDVTPVAAADGSMYCASYSGDFYYFRFRANDEEASP